MPTCCIIIPCYNEANRLTAEPFINFVNTEPNYSLLFVNDGSTDDTLTVLNSIKNKYPSRIHILNKNKNTGKAETIRAGMLHTATKDNFSYLAFLDADLATPINEIPLMVNILEKSSLFKIVLGSRVKRLGAKIERSEIRHYIGRFFVTYTNLLLSIGAYDSQCGAKVFDTSQINKLFSEPFISNWFFDIEILLRSNKNEILEMPISSWYEVGGSKLKIIDFITAPFEIIKIRKHYKSKNE